MWNSLRYQWRRVQVNHSGKYSIARLQALDTYYRTTSTLHVVLVCLATPLPTLAFLLVIECVPLEPPKNGWQANYIMWIRFMLTTVVMTESLVADGKALIPELSMSWKISLLISIATNAIDLACLLVFADKIAFPIPFMFAVDCVFYAISLASCLAIWFKAQPYERVRDPRRRVVTFLKYLSILFAPALIYPALSSAYLTLSELGQLLFTPVLFLVKLVLKNLMASVCRSEFLVAYVPEITIFTVELFHALFLTSNIKAGRSSPTVAILIVVMDVVFSIVELREIRIQERTLRSLISERHVGSTDLITTCLELCQANLVNNDASRFSAKQQDPLDGVRPSVRVEASPSISMSRQKIHPLVASPTITRAGSRAESSEAVDTMLEILFNCEYLVLLEYLECVIPLVYVVYTVARFHLSNAVYFPESRDMTESGLASLVTSILFFAGLEILTLVGFCVVVSKSLCLPVLYQLAFVLETQATRIQAKLVTWFIFNLFFSLQHYGACRGRVYACPLLLESLTTALCFVECVKALTSVSGSAGSRVLTPDRDRMRPTWRAVKPCGSRRGDIAQHSPGLAGLAQISPG